VDPPITTTVPPGTYTGDVILNEPQILESTSGPASTTIIGNGGYSGAVTFNAGASGTVGTPTQVGNLSGGGFTIQNGPNELAAVYISGGSNFALDGNVIDGVSTTFSPNQELLTASGISNVTVQGNTFEGSASQIVYVNGYIDTYQNSTNVNFIGNTFEVTTASVANGGAVIDDDASSSTISGNTFVGSGFAIFLGLLPNSAAKYYNATYGTAYGLNNAGSDTLTNNNFSGFTGTDIATFLAAYSFANGAPTQHTFTATVGSNGVETDTVTGYQNGDQIAIDTGIGITPLGVVQNGNNEADILLSSGDKIVVQGNNVNAGNIAKMVGAPALSGTYIQIPASATGNLGVVGGNGPTILDGSLTNGIAFAAGDGPDTVFGGNNDTIKVGNGPDTVWLPGSGNTLTIGNGPDTVEILGNSNNVTGGTGPDTFVLSGNNNSVVLKGNNDKVFIDGGTGNTVNGTSGLYMKVADTSPIGLTLNSFASNDVVDLVPGAGVPSTFSAVLGDMTQTAGGTVLSYNGNTIDFAGVMKSQFKASNFQFSS